MAGTATKTNRRKIARDLNREMRLYISSLEPHIETYLTSVGESPGATRLWRLGRVQSQLTRLLAAERDARGS